MKRGVLNIWIDCVSLLTFALMVSTGLILKFILPPGSGGRAETLLQEGGRGAGKSVDIFFNLTRHEWGEYHFILSLVFLVLLVVHLVLHWQWVRSVFWGTPEKPRPLGMRIAAIVSVIFIAATLIFPWTGGKQNLSRKEFRQQRSMTQGD